MPTTDIDDRARRLMQFLRAMQEMRTRAIRSVDEYPRVVWLSSVPAGDPRCGAAWASEVEQREGIWLSLDRVDRVQPPQAPEELEPWIDPADLVNSALDRPRLLPEAELPVAVVGPSGDRRTDYESVELDDRPQMHTRFAQWLPTWQDWASRDRADAQIRNAYNSVYALFQEQRGQVETLEIVLGLGLLSTTSGGLRVRRHIVTLGAVIDLDLATGQLVVKPDPDNAAPRLEEDMLDTLDRVSGVVADEVRSDLDNAESVFGEGGVVQAIRAWTHAYRSDAAMSMHLDPDAVRGATVVFAPALIVRKRGRESFVQAIDTVSTQLDNGTAVPPALAQLLLEPEDAQHIQDIESHRSPGLAAVVEDQEVYFPQAANEEQREIVDRLCHHRIVVVQGPPGTGKTHTIANLVTDLLAHGKRVLITSHGSRALKVLKDKLPDEVRDLCVSLADISTRGQHDLQRSVETIIDRVARQSVTGLDREHDRLVLELAQVRTERTTALDGLRQIREHETLSTSAHRGPYSGTPQQIAKSVAADEDEYGWIGQPDSRGERATAGQILRLAQLCLFLTDDTRRRALPRPPQSAIVSPEDFSRVCTRRATLQYRLNRLKESAGGQFAQLDNIEPRVVEELKRLCDGLLIELREINFDEYPWVESAIARVCAGQSQLVVQTRHEAATTREVISRDLDVVGSHQVTGLDAIDLVAESGHIHNLAVHLAEGGSLRRLGRPTKAARDANAALTALRVDGRSCTTAEDAQAAAAACAAELRLREFERHWGLQISGESHRLRAIRIDMILETLDRVLALEPRFAYAESLIGRVRGLNRGRWYDTEWVEGLADHLSGDDLIRQLKEIEITVLAAAAELRRTGSGVSEVGPAAAAALERWDPDAYAGAWPVLEHGWDVTRAVAELDSLGQQIRSSAPELSNAITANPDIKIWGPRSQLVEQAYAWAKWDSWLSLMIDSADESKLRNELDRADIVIKKLLLRIATNRAWRFCQSRMTATEQQNLKIYAKSTKRIGKGTGKYANQYRREARGALTKAQRAVPAWIMPLRSVVDTVPFHESGIFDVVIVDEASQSGHEALLLLWLGKQILVVGDDEQISPENIGRDHDAIFRQQAELLYDFPTRPVFGPTNSFLDHAEALAPTPVTLLEHFRCMPEIIGFSNQLSYHGRLLPVRQFGLDRLQPLRRTYITNGRVTGKGQRAHNEPEAMQVVEVIEKCCADPAYDDKSMGVITFLGNAQARLISDLLLERLGPVELENRGLRVDKPEAFQGDERDVIFLSLVASPEGEDGPQRIGAMTKRSDQQRLNVAASRARDQVWVFHSFRPEILPTGDFRRQHLVYLAEPVVEQLDKDLGEVLPDLPHAAFDSVFEQRVYLEIAKRGYRVRPQYPAGRYRVDLVVLGGTARLAVECDGDAYHDADREADDILRQRELERLGWTFWRVRGSQFFRDPEGSLVGLWESLERLGIESEVSVSETGVQDEVEAPEPAMRSEADHEQSWQSDAATVPAASPVQASRPYPSTNDLVVGPASLARLQREADLLLEDLEHGRDAANAGDARLRTAVLRDWKRREERLVSRLKYLRSTLDRANVVAIAELSDTAWPGAVIRYRDEDSGDTYDAVVGAVDLSDDAYERVSPSSPLGKLLASARVGQRMSFTKPNGESAVVEIVSLSD